MAWYRIEIDGMERAVELDMEYNEVLEAVQSSKCVAVKREVLVPTMPGNDGRMMVFFKPIEAIMPLAGARDPNQTALNMGAVTEVSRIDTDSEIWRMVRQQALNEVGVITPPKGVIVPS